MLAPEVWNIETKQTRKTEYRSEFKRYNKNHIDALIRSHHFNHNVSKVPIFTTSSSEGNCII